MRPYIAQFRSTFAGLLQYRSAALAGIVTQFCFSLLRLEVLAAFIAVGDSPLSSRQTADYVWLGQAFFWLIAIRPDPELPEMVSSGRLGCELLRPVDLHTFWLARSLARRLAPTALRAGPLLTICLLCGWLHPPVSWAAGLAFAGSLACAAVLSAALTLVIAQTALWTVAADGVALLLPSLAWFCSGLILPLPMFPDWLRPLIENLPFAGILDTPARIWMGETPPVAALGLIAKQLGWCAGLILLGRLMARRGLARIAVAGG